MKTHFVILALGAAAAAASFLVVSRLRTSSPTGSLPSQAAQSGHATHHLHASTDTDLSWLAEEFHLDDAAFEQVRKLHAEYRPRCEQLCRRIDDHNRRLNAAILASRELTPETTRLIEEGARVRMECQTALAQHLLQVAQCMPPPQGKRYLELMLPATGITAASHPIGDFTHAKPRE